LFRDLAGKINQILASKADQVYLTIAGLPLEIKSLSGQKWSD
jgi:adenosylcobinamide kinase/adenosylcobinamide-phosphate guanylyltransferase